MEGGEGADAERNLSKLVVAEIQCPNGWCNHMKWQRTMLIVGEIQNMQYMLENTHSGKAHIIML